MLLGFNPNPNLRAAVSQSEVAMAVDATSMLPSLASRQTRSLPVNNIDMKED